MHIHIHVYKACRVPRPISGGFWRLSGLFCSGYTPVPACLCSKWMSRVDWSLDWNRKQIKYLRNLKITDSCIFIRSKYNCKTEAHFSYYIFLNSRFHRYEHVDKKFTAKGSKYNMKDSFIGFSKRYLIRTYLPLKLVLV